MLSRWKILGLTRKSALFAPMSRGSSRRYHKTGGFTHAFPKHPAHCICKSEVAGRSHQEPNQLVLARTNSHTVTARVRVCVCFVFFFAHTRPPFLPMINVQSCTSGSITPFSINTSNNWIKIMLKIDHFKTPLRVVVRGCRSKRK